MIVDGVTVHYETHGSGPHVFLLHGWGSNLTLFRPIAEVIAQKYTVVSLDFPGCGQSGEPDEPWGIEQYGHFVTSFIAHFGLDEAIILGHSHGGRVALYLAAQTDLPFRITTLILVDSAGLVPARSIAYRARVRAYKLGKAVLTSPPVKRLFPQAVDGFQKVMGSSDYAAASPVMRGSLVKVVNTDLAPLLPQIKAETLLIWGDADQDTPLSDGRAMEAAIPGAGLVVLTGAGHYSFLDQPYVFRRVIESFLQIG
ncbi:MAG: alpha/beta hydrolase [Propionibacteriaceae bacterium]|nr:alpha/beta hydrolase [Propionibacteriaceae bacterium]